MPPANPSVLIRAAKTSQEPPRVIARDYSLFAYRLLGPSPSFLANPSFLDQPFPLPPSPFPLPPSRDYCSRMPFSYDEFDVSTVRTYPLSSRANKARAEDFARPVARGASFKSWLDSLPAILGAADVRRAVDAIVAAKIRDAGVV